MDSDDIRFQPQLRTSAHVSSESPSSNMLCGQMALFSSPASHEATSNTGAPVVIHPHTSRSTLPTSLYAQASVPASDSESASHRTSWPCREQEQYPLQRHSLSLDMDVKSSTYSPAPSSALSVTSTSFSYSPFASPVEPRMGTKSYFGNAQYEPVPNDVADGGYRGSDTFVFPVSSSHEGGPRWYGAKADFTMSIGPKSTLERGAEAFSPSHPDFTNMPRAAATATAGNFTTNSISGDFSQIGGKVGNVASDVSTGAGEADQIASRPVTLSRESMQSIVPQHSPYSFHGQTSMAQNWTSQQHSQGTNPGTEGHSSAALGSGVMQGASYTQSADSTRKAFFAASTGSTFNFTAQTQERSLGTGQHFEYDTGELSDDLDVDDFDDPFDADFGPEGRLAGYGGGTDAFVPGVSHPGYRSSPASAFTGPGQGATTAASNAACFQQPECPPRARSPAPELQFPPGISGTPSDFDRGVLDPGTTHANLMYDWKKMRKLSDPGDIIDASTSKTAGDELEQSSPPGAQLPHKLDPAFDRASNSKAKRNHADSSSLGLGSQAVKVTVESTKPGEPPKKVKMHQCGVCSKLFPRPSGLATHMNSHSGARPYKCPLALCPKTFAVRSNARRHLRTHGITIPPPSLRGGRADESFQVGFETPVVVDVHDPSTFLDGGDQMGDEQGADDLAFRRDEARGRTTATKLRWVPQSLADRSNAAQLRSISPMSDMADVDSSLGPLPCAQATSANATANGEPAVQIHSTYHGMDRIEAPYPSYMLGQPHSGYDIRVAADRAGLRIAPAPLPPVIPTDETRAGDLHARFEERNSQAEAGTQPYHPDQVSQLQARY